MKNSLQVKTGNLSDPRRDFLKKTGSLAIMSMFGVGFFTSCSSDEDTNPNTGNNNPPAGATGITVSGNTVTINLDQATGLNVAGGWVLIIPAQLLVVNVGNNSFNALTSVCTHSGCDKDWRFASNVFTCTCHGSRFSTDGNVLTGPANQALASFPTRLDNKILTITKS
ncbi:hypothetical protein P872_20275 [Rhodonellum psychrophilum GCM71 = DSM 17998]|uniref:Rieske domain-containing protein n=2 Tax=Rhodonellum TaxID=336827 RepID=U5BL61_9BACT|nr:MULTISPECIES: Rieske (2Fe-2S) protein [Rhodonellum]ERM81225.1 hypothetical protein P872_20275 [Rhodonellum psychrophilum GCM71 = DSM 17998]MDO9554671.1 Rieske (2Fe-2S) protein [Rhodonellum sp.]SDZ52235.1 Rieske [2Fe-2S] domain-containing protein [Rhodonellum ikkaensis]